MRALGRIPASRRSWAAAAVGRGNVAISRRRLRPRVAGGQRRLRSEWRPGWRPKPADRVARASALATWGFRTAKRWPLDGLLAAVARAAARGQCPPALGGGACCGGTRRPPAALVPRANGETEAGPTLTPAVSRLHLPRSARLGPIREPPSPGPGPDGSHKPSQCPVLPYTCPLLSGRASQSLTLPEKVLVWTRDPGPDASGFWKGECSCTRLAHTGRGYEDASELCDLGQAQRPTPQGLGFPFTANPNYLPEGTVKNKVGGTDAA